MNPHSTDHVDQTVGERLTSEALDRGLRRSTVLSYRRLLRQAGLHDLPISEATPEAVQEALWTIDNPNTRRAAIIACRTALGMRIKIPRALPRRYNLPDEDTLRLALMTSPHEIRGLLMMYGGLRLGEACAVRANDINGDRLTVARQVQQLTETGKPTVAQVGPTKTGERQVVLPWWLAERTQNLDCGDSVDYVKPMSVRESLRRAGQKVGISLNPHQLRHWHATTLIDRGVPLALVSRQLGHSDVSVTLRTYQQSRGAEDIHRVFG